MTHNDKFVVPKDKHCRNIILCIPLESTVSCFSVQRIRVARKQRPKIFIHTRVCLVEQGCVAASDPVGITS